MQSILYLSTVSYSALGTPYQWNHFTKTHQIFEHFCFGALVLGFCNSVFEVIKLVRLTTLSLSNLDDPP